MRVNRPFPVCLIFFAAMAPLAAADVTGTGGSAGSAPPDPRAVPAAFAAPLAPAVSPSPAPPPPVSSEEAAKPAAPAASPAPTQEPENDHAILAEVAARATPRLKELVARQNVLLAALGRDDVDQDNVKRDLQNLAFDYDEFLQKFPNFAPGYVPYGLLLRKVGMRRESVAIFLKANRLDPDIPIVKNQLGDYLAEEGEPIEAANYFISATRLAPEEPLYHFQLGTVMAEARDDFLKSGLWTRVQIDRTMQEAFRRASELAPKNFAYAYRYAQSFYDIADPDWDGALKVWGALEDQCSPGLEKETIRLQAANVLIKQKKFDRARTLLGTVEDERLKVQKQKLLDQLMANAEK
jgi:tetratricopeptide (TPR) repeat protein